ncbi:ankyrin repeat-containing protein [Moumouvirus maliensis]|nr:ankyrin repeat-containing protein [Moumouvirus maliensis]
MQSGVYYKFTRDNEKNGDYQFVDGINRIDENDSLNNKKLIFFKAKNAFSCLYIGAKYLREVKVEKDWIISSPDSIASHRYYAKKMIFTTRLDLTDVTTITYLINKGANISARGNYALKWACNEGYINIVKYIFSLINPDSKLMNECLHFAIKDGKLDVVKFLIEKGAEFCPYNNHHIYDSFEICSRKGHMETVKYLLSLVNDVNKLFCFYDKNMRSLLSDVEYCKILVERGLGYGNHNECLKHCVKNGYIDSVKYLVSIGADIQSI